MHVIEVSGLTKFSQGKKIIDNLDLIVKEGESFGIISKNHSQISTLFKILLNYVHPSKGLAMVFGMNSVIFSKAIKQWTAYMPYDIKLNGNMTAKSLLKDVSKFYRKEDQSLEEEISIIQFILDIDLGLKLNQCSMLDLRKVWIIKTLITLPSLAVLDHPIIGLDPVMKTRVIELFKDYKQQGNHILISSNDIDCLLNLCDKIGMMEDGRIKHILKIKDIYSNNMSKMRKAFLDKYKRIIYDEEIIS
jgi:ABC-2 type transport system ATP-binding protein